MPSVSKKQRNFMAAASHNPSFAKKAGIPQSVAKEFNRADKGKNFRSGGDVANYKSSNGKVYTDKGAYISPERAKSMSENAPKGTAKALSSAMQEARDYKESRKIVDRINPEGGSSVPDENYKKGGRIKKYASGGNVSNLKKLFKGKESYSEELKEGKAIKSGKISPEQYAKGEKMEKSTKMKSGGCTKMAKGGSASSRADGCATKGKTKGRFV